MTDAKNLCQCAGWCRDYAFKVFTKHHINCPQYVEMDYVKITSLSQGGSYIDTMGNIPQIVDMLAETSVGEGYRLEKVRMPPEEFESLPEFGGF